MITRLVEEWAKVSSLGEFYRGYCEIGLRMLWRVISDPRLFRQITHETPEEEANRKVTAKRNYKLREEHKEEIADLIQQLPKIRAESDRKAAMKRIRYLRQLVKKSEYMERYRRTEKNRQYRREWMRTKRERVSSCKSQVARKEEE